VLAGKGIVAGATARDARLVDIAPTVAALLGVPAPGHAEGRALVEILALSAEEAARRSTADAARATAIAAVTDVHGDLGVLWLVAVAAGLAIAGVLGRRHLRPSSLAGVLGFTAMLAVMVVITRGRLSPSYIPSLARTEKLGGLGAAFGIGLQVVVCWLVIRRTADRLAAANAAVLAGLAISLATVGTVRAWFSAPFLDVPSPFWMVAIPALDLAAATCALGSLLTLAIAAVRRR